MISYRSFESWCFLETFDDKWTNTDQYKKKRSDIVFFFWWIHKFFLQKNSTIAKLIQFRTFLFFASFFLQIATAITQFCNSFISIFMKNYQFIIYKESFPKMSGMSIVPLNFLYAKCIRNSLLQRVYGRPKRFGSCYEFHNSCYPLDV